MILMMIAIVISLLAVLMVILLAVFPIRVHWFVRPRGNNLVVQPKPRRRAKSSPVKKPVVPFKNTFVFSDDDDYDDKEL